MTQSAGPQAILDANQGLPKLSRPADATLLPLRDYVNAGQLSLVSALVLRKMLGNDGGNGKTSGATKFEPVGFNPCDSYEKSARQK